MPRRQLLSTQERESLFQLPETQQALIQLFAFNEKDLSIIRQHRGAHNRLGFAILLCYMRYPGVILPIDQKPNILLLETVSQQLNINLNTWDRYSTRSETRREHLLEIQSVYNFVMFTTANHYKPSIKRLQALALQTDKGILLANELMKNLREQNILLPSIHTIERICAAAVTQSERSIYKALTAPLSADQRSKLESLLMVRENSNITGLTWLRQSPAAINAKHILEHIERCNAIEALDLPPHLDKKVHQNRLLKLARSGGQMTTQHLFDLEPTRRHATLVAVLLEAKATIIDEIVHLHDRMIGLLFSRAKNKHQQQFHKSGKEINKKVLLYWKIGSALLAAKQTGEDPFSAIESMMSWEAFSQSINEAGHLAQSETFDYIHLIGDHYTQIRRYAPALLETLQLKAATVATDLLNGVEILKKMNADHTRKLPLEVPTSFIRKRWKTLIFKDGDIDKKFYELCVFTELKNTLRSGDIWVQGSRQFKDFETYLLPMDQFDQLKIDIQIPLTININKQDYLKERLTLLNQQLTMVNKLAAADAIPDITFSDSGFKMSPLAPAVPKEADILIQRVANLLPHIKITDLLIEVDSWTGFTKHFTHLKKEATTPDNTLLLTVILADAINLGLTKMSESCPGSTYSKLAWLQAWYIRDETYTMALAELVNVQNKHPMAAHWGDGSTSSSDGQRFRTTSHAERRGHVNPKYGNDPGVQVYTHISDQYMPFHSKVIHVGVRDATYVLDGLLYHESNLKIEEHYTDTAGFTDHVFALMHLLGFKFAPRIRDLTDKRLFIPKTSTAYPYLAPLIGGTINEKHIIDNWDDVLRLATSIQQGVVTASLIVRKIGSYPRQNSLALALREIGRIERTLFALNWLVDPDLRRRVHIGLNKGEARNALARAVFFNRLGEIRDRNLETQNHRASGLTLVTAAITLWNTVYIERAVNALREHGVSVDDNLLQYLSPLGWEHINLTGDYVWKSQKRIKKGKYRPLRMLSNP